MESDYQRFTLDYHNKGMELRTTVNPHIGMNIERIINQHPDCTHIITCGDAHITQNPLYNYVPLPRRALGVVDASPMGH